MHSKIIPVIHYASYEQALRNAEIAFDAGCEGVFLIHMRGLNQLLGPAAKAVKNRWPDKLVGVNYLGHDPATAVAASISEGLDMTWFDEQLTHSEATDLSGAVRVRDAMAANRNHFVFAGVAFKGQKNDQHPGVAARKAVELGFIPTTSGPATGVAANVAKVAGIREALGAHAPLAIASGITPENASAFAPHLSHILVASGVSTSFHELDFEKLYRLRAVVGNLSAA